VFKAPLPNLLVHIHGAVFSSWILLLIVQTPLVAGGRVDVHRRLSVAASMSNGCPFFTSIFSTNPSGPMRQFKEILPSTCVCLANAG
jgi:hypothetical protein